MNTQRTIETLERLYNRKQAIPTQVLRDAIIELKAQLALNKQQAERIAKLEAEKRETQE